MRWTVVPLLSRQPSYSVLFFSFSSFSRPLFECKLNCTILPPSQPFQKTRAHQDQFGSPLNVENFISETSSHRRCNKWMHYCPRPWLRRLANSLSFGCDQVRKACWAVMAATFPFLGKMFRTLLGFGGFLAALLDLISQISSKSFSQWDLLQVRVFAQVWFDEIRFWCPNRDLKNLQSLPCYSENWICAPFV